MKLDGELKPGSYWRTNFMVRGPVTPEARVKYSQIENNGGSTFLLSVLPEALGTGSATAADLVEMQWPKPGGRVERFVKPRMDR